MVEPMSLSIDKRREMIHSLGTNLKTFSHKYQSTSLKHKYNLLVYLMDKEGFNTPEHSARLVEELGNIRAIAATFPYHGKRAFDLSVISPQELEELILCWKSFSSLKAMIVSLAELSLVFPVAHEEFSTVGEFNLTRNQLREDARKLMPLEEITFLRFQKFFSFSEAFLDVVSTANFYPESGDCKELIAEYQEKHDELYCEAVVALS